MNMDIYSTGILLHLTPTLNITPEETNNQNQDTILSTTQVNTFILSTSHTNVTQPSQTQRSPRHI